MLVSVIIPAYNVEKTLERAVKSVMLQTYREIEILIVDDGSPDNSGLIADRLAEEDSRIRVIHQINGGLSAARNTGIEEAEGIYIAFLDSDDEFELDIIETFVSYYEQHQMDLFIFNINRLNLQGTTSLLKNAKNGIFTDTEEALNAIFTHNGLDFYAWNKIYKASLFDEIRYPVGKLYEDTRVSYGTVVKSQKVVTTDKVGIKYYENDESIVAQSFNPKQMDNVTERLIIHSDIKLNYPSLVPLSSKRVIDGILSTAYKLATVDEFKNYSEYDHKLKQLFKDNKEDFDKSVYVDWKRIAAFQLYSFSPKLYAKVYRLYLNK